MPAEVTVVVPVYNPGEFIEPTIASLLAQTLPPGRLELIFVDDGSTDETPARLDKLAAEHPHVRVFHEPPSGWPGRPRNVGIDAAQGEYVYFVDHDDVLAPDAMECMLATARRTDADIVLGKIVGVGRGAPLGIFTQNVDHATLGETPLMTNLTPHKLFRKSMLDEHGIRFPEGKRRLEDHVFVTRTYFAARNIAVLSDRPIYYHLARPDAGNAARRPFDPAGYYGNVRETLDVIDAHTGPGELREQLRSRFLETEALRRLDDERYSRWDADYLRELVNASGEFIAERYDDEAVDALPPVTRARAYAVRARNVDDLLDIVEHTKDVVGLATLTDIDWADGAWILTVRGELTHPDGRPVTVTSVDGGWALDPTLLPTRHQSAPYDTEQLTNATVGVVLRNRKTGVQWVVPVDLDTTIEPLGGPAPDAHRVVVNARVRLEPDGAAAGGRLTAGTWEITTRVVALGIGRMTKLVPAAGRVPDTAPVLFGPAPHVATISRLAKRRGLAVVVRPPGPQLVRRLARGPLRVADLSKQRLTLEVDLSSAPDAAHVRGHVRVNHGGRAVARLPARLADGRLSMRLRGTALPDGAVALRLRLRKKTKPVQIARLEIGRTRSGRPEARLVSDR